MKISEHWPAVGSPYVLMKVWIVVASHSTMSVFVYCTVENRWKAACTSAFVLTDGSWKAFRWYWSAGLLTVIECVQAFSLFVKLDFLELLLNNASFAQYTQLVIHSSKCLSYGKLFRKWDVPFSFEIISSRLRACDDVDATVGCNDFRMILVYLVDPDVIPSLLCILAKESDFLNHDERRLWSKYYVYLAYVRFSGSTSRSSRLMI